MSKTVEEILKEKGLSLTKARKIILSFLIENHGPFTAEEIYENLEINSCDLATVYRTLTVLKKEDIVLEAHFDKEFVRYEFNDPHHHHHHIVCNKCKKIETIDGCLVDEFEDQITKMGYSNISHRIEFFGTCKDCS